MSAGCEASGDRHEKYARRYPTTEIDGLVTVGPFLAGERPVPNLRGWLLLVAVRPGNNAHLTGRLLLRAAWKGDEGLEVDGFVLYRGGITYVPWPVVALSIENSGEGADPSTVAVNWVPVFRDEPADPAISSVLTGHTATQTGGPEPPHTAGFLVPEGATSYRVMPRSATVAELTVREMSPEGELARYNIASNGTATVLPGTETGTGAWRHTPGGVDAGIVIESGATNGAGVTVYWRYDLGALR